jgi:hypothetical protein
MTVDMGVFVTTAMLDVTIGLPERKLQVLQMASVDALHILTVH